MDTLWPKVLDSIRKEMKPSSFDNWFANPAIVLNVSRKDHNINIYVSDEFTQAYMEQTFTSLVESALLNITGQVMKARFLDNSAEEQILMQEKEAEPVQSPPVPALFHPRYTFDSFVVGSSNRFAHAAALAVSERPSQTYNPLFIYGGSGLGKTHLMHAIGQAVLKNNPQKKVAYVSTETFTNEFISLVRSGKAHNFKNRYRFTDIFLIDDIQFLTGKEGTQEEFFHTFNALHEAGKQIVISSDRPPKEIETLEERLRSRFEGGLITDIQAPNFETRCAILLRKIASLKRNNEDTVEIPEDVLFYIASKIRSNIRELEGALNKIIYYANLYNIPQVDINQTKEVLQGLIPDEDKPRLTIALVQKAVAEYYQISVEAIQGPKRDRYLSHPRHVAMYLCREMIGATLPQIGRDFGKRDHATVIHGIKNIDKDLDNNHQTKQDIDKIKQLLLG